MAFFQVPHVAIVGGGAAGFFAAIQLAESVSGLRISLFEKHRQVLAKVKISGGGRCNVTHACFDPQELIRAYPRGGKELLGPFYRFQPRDMIAWFSAHGVSLKTENDGRVFPTTDSSQTILDCLLDTAAKEGVILQSQCGIAAIQKREDRFLLTTDKGEEVWVDAVLLATGSGKQGYGLAERLGHTIIRPVPSLFAFCIKDPFSDLAGISVPEVIAALPRKKREQRGPLLLTPWGMTGPAILKLSAWAARDLEEVAYFDTLTIDWAVSASREEIGEKVRAVQKSYGMRQLQNEPVVSLPKRLWKALLQKAGIDASQYWGQLRKEDREKIVEVVKRSVYQVIGKTTHKEEFVTAGGVDCLEVDWTTMESRACSGLFFAGEILDVDGITGGFNFQNAWTTAWHAAKGISEATRRF